MSYCSIFLMSFTIALSGALAPGPLLTAVIVESGRNGVKTGPLVTLGHALVELAMIAIILLGLVRILDQPLVIRSVALAGAAVLMIFGIQLLCSLKTVSLQPAALRARTGNLVWLGMTLSMLNPYWILWWLSIGAGLTLSAWKVGWTGIALFFLGHILADLAWYSFIALSINKSKQLLTQRTYTAVLAGCAFLLLLFGAGFAWYAFKA